MRAASQRSALTSTSKLIKEGSCKIERLHLAHINAVTLSFHTEWSTEIRIASKTFDGQRAVVRVLEREDTKRLVVFVFLELH
jgi:hypothetical protein